MGSDQRDYQEKPKFEFRKWDILDDTEIKPETFDYITCVSVIEHIGVGAYGDKVGEGADRVALFKLHKLLKTNGRLILTTPNQFWANDNGRGYTYTQFMTLIYGLFNVYEMTERNGQICAVLEKF